MSEASPNNTPKRFVIIGAGIAGVSAAESIRAADPQARITLLSEDSEAPYFRMSLTRYLAGEIGTDKLELHPPDWYAGKQIELLLDHHAANILPDQQVVELADGSLVPYDTLILATGASPFVPPFQGANLPGVHTLRTIADTDAILNACQRPIHVVCIGGGLLGLEVAGAIARRNVKVTVVESLAWLLPRQLDAAASSILQEKIEAMGISVITGARTQALVGEERVRGVRLEDGRLLEADLVVISAGVTPNLDLARKAGLTINRGIVVDDHMRTSDAHIYAAGDDAEHHGRLYGLWVPSKNEGSVAGQSAAGKDVVFAGDPPSARLKVLGIDLFSIGQFMPQAENERLISQASDGTYAGFLFRDGVMIGAILLGDASLAGPTKSAVEGGKDFSELLTENTSAAEVQRMLKG